MKMDEIENCTFEPNVGSLNPVKPSKNVTKNAPERLFAETKPGEFFESLGVNFCKSNPKIFKQGIMKLS
jgi:hypothetical protein